MQFPQKRYAMDERLPSGKTMAESIDPTMGTGIDTRWLDEKLLGGGSPTFATPQNVQPVPQIAQGNPAQNNPAPFAGEGFERLTGGLGQPAPSQPNAPTMPPIANDGTIQGTVSNEQISPYEAAKQRYNEKLQEQPKYAAWKEALFLGLQGMAKVFDQNPTPPIRMLKDVRKDYNDQRAMAEFAPIAQQYERDQVNAERQKRMENIDADNKARDAKDKAALALNRRKAFSQRYKNFDPKNATPAQIRELAEFGETPDSIGKYDFGSRDSKTIGADTYKWDNNANAYVIQGNLHDKSKALTSLTFETPDQEVVTMWVPSTQAATILAQRERTGWQLRQRQELQEDAQNFRLGQKNQPTTNSANYSSPTAPKTGKTTEAAARAYLGKKLKGDALENAIKTARANGEIQ